VELVDGTLLPADDIRIAKGRLSLLLAVPGATSQTPIAIPVAQVTAVRLKPLQGAAADQWQEIREQEFASDVLLVAKRGGENLDYVEGVLGDIGANKIEFKLDDEPLEIDRAKAAGFIYFRRNRESGPDPRCVLQGRSGLRASASSVRLADSLLHVKMLAGLEVTWPLSDIESADFSAGKLRYLSDIQQVTVQWAPLVAFPSGADAAAKYGQPHRDQSAYGGPLTLLFGDADSLAPPSRLRSFNKGLAIHSRTEMLYRLPPGFTRFMATAGIEPASAPAGNVQFLVYGDDRPLLETAIAGQQPPHEIELDIKGVKRLKIVVDFGQNLDTGDWLNLCDARLVK
jgi:hypothetical protein